MRATWMEELLVASRPGRPAGTAGPPESVVGRRQLHQLMNCGTVVGRTSVATVDSVARFVYPQPMRISRFDLRATRLGGKGRLEQLNVWNRRVSGTGRAAAAIA